MEACLQESVFTPQLCVSRCTPLFMGSNGANSVGHTYWGSESTVTRALEHNELDELKHTAEEKKSR